PIRRPGRENAREGFFGIVARVNLQNVTIPLMEPRQQDHLLSRGDALQCIDERRIDLDPRLRRTLEALLGGVAPGSEPGADHADRTERIGGCRGHRLFLQTSLNRPNSEPTRLSRREERRSTRAMPAAPSTRRTSA